MTQSNRPADPADARPRFPPSVYNVANRTPASFE